MAGDAARPAATAAIAVVVSLFAAACKLAACTHSLCNDEAKHILTGYRVLERGQCCLGGDNSPLTAVFALPAMVMGATPLEGLEMGDPVHEAAHAWLFRQADPERIVFAARCMTIAVGTAMLVALAALAWRHFGPLAAVACDPTALGHFSLVSTDALVAAAVVGCLMVLDWWSRRPGVIPAGCVGAALGLAFLCKFTAVALGPAVLVFAWLHRGAITAPRLRTAAIQAVGCGLVAIAAIWLCYGAHLEGAFPCVAFPGLQAGLEQSRIDAVGGMPSFFCGWIGWHHPWYFLFAPLVKLPIPLLLLWMLVLAGTLWVRSPEGGVPAMSPGCGSKRRHGCRSAADMQ